MSPLDNLGINPGFLLIQIIAFIVLYTVMTRFVYDPLINVLQNRRTKIAKGLEDAAAAAKARQNAEAEAEKILAQARTEAQKVIDEARGRGEDVAKTIQQDAAKAADKIKSDAQADSVAARNAQLGDVRDQVLSISVAVARQIIGESIDEKKQKSLVDNFISNIPEGAKGLSGNVEVVSALPLSDAEKKKVQDTIGGGSVNFSVDPSILGGLIVRSSTRVVDGSVRSKLNNLSASLA